ncbi:hypothetical protein ACFVVX_19190 [Kitasatospora sp. NPDC058170]|uniref:hypothetical protein n=1 Tax=Kitasatospora sp. NPDC058170 TaxID=3346364 RepID=UPI0036DC7BF1
MAVLPVLVIGSFVLVWVLFMLGAPTTWCRDCRHQRTDHEDGTGPCGGEDFDVGELSPNGRTCPCDRYRDRRGPRRHG